ncbi:MAG: DUF2254 domain-containing protein [Pseudomonadota bacterium]
MTGDTATANAMQRDLLRLRSRIRLLRGFVTVPGLFSLSGLLIGGLSVWGDGAAQDVLGLGPFDVEISRTVLSTLAGAAMTALSLVYSMVLVVFTLAAGTIAPRLLERFAKDRMNQIAVGSLGALFLHSLTALAMTDGPQLLPVIVAGMLAVHSILFLLFFVDHVSRRITIDEEIASIAGELDAQLRVAARRSSGIETDDIVLPSGDDEPIRAPRSGYLCHVAVEELSAIAAERSGVVDFMVTPGDPVLKGDVMARALGPGAKALVTDARAAVTIADRRTADSDLRFSVNLLVEIALRALSPGINDGFTAIACIDRLTASLAEAAERGLTPGVHCDDDGAVRVVIPRVGIAELIRVAFDPIRRNASGSGLVIGAMIAALRRLEPRLGPRSAKEAQRQLSLIMAEVDASALLDDDKAYFRDLAGLAGA